LAGGSILKSSSPIYIHQYILFLLLTYRIRRDLLFIDSMETPTNKSVLKAISVQSIKRKTQAAKSTTSVASKKKPTSKHYAKRDISDSRSKREEALKALQAVTKLYDSIVQSVEQIGGLTIVEERENVWRGVNGFEAYVKAIKYVLPFSLSFLDVS
jgi:signal recognition particle subunit SRP68